MGLPQARLHVKGIADTTQPYIPLTDYWQGGWGSTIADYSIACQALDASYIESSATQAAIGTSIGLEKPLSTTGSTADWVLHIVARKNTTNAVIGCTLNFGINVFTPSSGWTGLGGTGGIFSLGTTIFSNFFFGTIASGGQPLTTEWVDYQRSITPTEMAALFVALNNYPTQILTARFVTRSNTSPPNNGTAGTFIQINQVYLTGPGQIGVEAAVFQEGGGASQTQPLARIHTRADAVEAAIFQEGGGAAQTAPAARVHTRAGTTVEAAIFQAGG
jgi:hypothetical protein